MKLVSVAEMKAIESEANEKGLTYEQMMENAGNGLGDHLKNAYSHIGEPFALMFIGAGNNGGDTLIALARLAALGWRVTGYLVKNRPVEDEPLKRFQIAGGEVLQALKIPALTLLREVIDRVHLILDGVLGTGSHLPLKGEIARNSSGAVKSDLAVGSNCPALLLLPRFCPPL